jgi:hypothetical protein
VGQFVYVIRKRIKLSPEKAIFIFVKNVLPPTGRSLMRPQVTVNAAAVAVAAAACSIYFGSCSGDFSYFSSAGKPSAS